MAQHNESQPDSAIGEAIAAMVYVLERRLGVPPEAAGIDPAAENAFWRSELCMRPYYQLDYTFDQDYAPAYGMGYFLRATFPTCSFEEIEDEFHRDWNRVRGNSRLQWGQARGAVADAWHRCDELNAFIDVEPRGLGQPICE